MVSDVGRVESEFQGEGVLVVASLLLEIAGGSGMPVVLFLFGLCFDG